MRQFGEWGNTAPGRHILVAVARYLAAHAPTERDIRKLCRSDCLGADQIDWDIALREKRGRVNQCQGPVAIARAKGCSRMQVYRILKG